jgi:hypothetical protein
MHSSVKKIQQSIESLRQQIISHPVFEHIGTLDELGMFMKYHIYAVCDFMSLLKALQNKLTCTAVPGSRWAMRRPGT